MQKTIVAIPLNKTAGSSLLASLAKNWTPHNVAEAGEAAKKTMAEKLTREAHERYLKISSDAYKNIAKAKASHQRVLTAAERAGRPGKRKLESLNRVQEKLQSPGFVERTYGKIGLTGMAKARERSRLARQGRIAGRRESMSQRLSERVGAYDNRVHSSAADMMESDLDNSIRIANSKMDLESTINSTPQAAEDAAVKAMSEAKTKNLQRRGLIVAGSGAGAYGIHSYINQNRAPQY